MAASKKQIVETFTKVSGVGESYAEQMYDELGLRSLDDLVTAAEEGKIQSLKGIGAAKEKSILKSAKDLLSTSPKTKSPAKKSDETKADTKKKSKKADTKKSKKSDSKKSEKKADKKPAPEASAKKEAPKKAAEAEKKEAPKKETPKRAPRSSASDFEDRARKSSASPGKRPTIPGLIFKIGKKLVSRLLS